MNQQKLITNVLSLHYEPNTSTLIDQFVYYKKNRRENQRRDK